MTVVLKQRGPMREAVKRFRRWWRRWRADVHIVSFPKCGRTWLVLLIAKAIEHHYGITRRKPLQIRGYCSRRHGIPCMHAHHDGGPEFLLPEELSRDKAFYRNRKVIFLARDPRDVLVSSYFQKTKRNHNYVGDMNEYVHERRGGIEAIVEFYNIWADNTTVPEDFLLLTYEDLHGDTEHCLRRALDFIGLRAISDEAVRAAVAYCSFDNMRSLESDNALRTGALSARDPNDQDSYKTRRGAIGGYTEYLRGDDLAHVEAVIDARLAPMFERYRTSPTGSATSGAAPANDGHVAPGRE